LREKKKGDFIRIILENTKQIALHQESHKYIIWDHTAPPYPNYYLKPDELKNEPPYSPLNEHSPFPNKKNATIL
jgi:hypothetical protein